MTDSHAVTTRRRSISRVAFWADWAGSISGTACLLMLLYERMFPMIFMAPGLGNPWAVVNFYNAFGHAVFLPVCFFGWLSFGVCEAAMIVYLGHRREGARVPWLGIVGTGLAFILPLVNTKVL